ncbi:MAG: acyl-CoA dehydrogenase family protein [Planctomycetota bacterium]
MDFEDTQEEAAFREEARTWLEAHAEPLAEGERPITLADWRERENAVSEAKAWMATKADDGWACITWPSEYGGRDATAIQNVIWGQEEARYRVPPNMFTIGQGMLGPTIMAHGTNAQKSRHLQPMLRADEVWCQLFSEPDAGSDLANLRTAATPDGDEWVINGQKIWTSGAHYSDWGMIVTRTDPNVPKHEGLTYFIVDMKSPGIEIRPIKQMNGAAGFNEVFFSDVRVADDARIGAVGDGWRGAITNLMNERSTIGGGGAVGPGIHELIELAEQTDWGGQTALSDSAVRQRIARFYIRTKGAQYTRYRTLTALSRGQTPGPEGSIGKLVGAALRQEMAGFACDVLGTAGALTDLDTAGGAGAWQEALLSAPGGRLAGGTDEVMRNIIAERVLRLPPEVRVDKDRPFRDVPSGRS